MLRNNIKYLFCKLQKRQLHLNQAAAKLETEKCEIEKIRNIGILAHIDAGKTTTTERMLYYSGFLKQMGEVHDGNTVTDFMDQERERGITIYSAAVSFIWQKFLFHLIDTPGHIDFTMAVEQPLSVIDGVVVILDGNKGVEAQTITVWKQADRYNLPRIVFVNKMDKPNASFEMNLKSLETKLNTVVFPVHMPFMDENGFAGVIDIITLEKYIFDANTKGKTVHKSELSIEKDTALFEEAREMRKCLTDKLTDFDTELTNAVLEQDSLDKISSQLLVDALRRATIACKGVPVLLGSSYKNIGVQSLMNAVVLYLPSPNYNQNRKHFKYFNNSLSAKVFKIIHDKHKGPISFFRVYTGTLKKHESIYNISQKKMEKCGGLFNVFADEYEEVKEITKGNIGAITGFLNTEAGDFLTDNTSSLKKAIIQMQNNSLTTEEIENIFSRNRNIPDPVFFCSIEAPSHMYVSALEKTLKELTKEDPSLRVNNDSETGQITLSGMGELHIDTIKERIRSEYKIDVEIGKLQIAYKEAIKNHIEDTFFFKNEINAIRQEVTVTVSLVPDYFERNKLIVSQSKNNEENITLLKDYQILKSIRKGVLSAFTRGPKLNCPVINTGVRLKSLDIKPGTTNSMIIAAISQSINKLMDKSDSVLLEPIMSVEITTSNTITAKILTDLYKRRAIIENIDKKSDTDTINCMVPLSELLGYSNTLRKLSSGTATIAMELSCYQEMNLVDQENVKRKIHGFD